MFHFHGHFFVTKRKMPRLIFRTIFHLLKIFFRFLPGISPASYFTPGNPYHLGSHLSSQTSPQANQQVFFWKHSMIRCLCLHFSSKPHRIPHHSSLCIPQLLRLLERASYIVKLRNVKNVNNSGKFRAISWEVAKMLKKSFTRKIGKLLKDFCHATYERIHTNFVISVYFGGNVHIICGSI